MTTYNTGNPIGSTDARDRLDNSESLDLAVNSLSPTFVDRLGVTRDTLEGVYQKSAYYRAGTFDDGYTLTNNRQTLAYGNVEYSWSGAFPKVVTAGSTPATSGGIGAGAWVDRTDVTLRDEVRETTFQTMKRSYAEAGFNLVDGSFQMGGSLSGWPDVLWDWATGVAYQWHLDEAKTIPSGSTPETTGGIGAGAWVDVSDTTLKKLLSGNSGAASIGTAEGVTVQQAFDQMKQNLPFLKDAGAKGDGVTDDSAICYAVSGKYIVSPGVYLLGTSGTINANLEVMEGAVFVIAAGVTVNFSQILSAPDERRFIRYANLGTSRVNINANNFVSLGWFDHATDGTDDWSAIINHLISAAKSGGRDIFCPPGRRLLSQSVSFQDKNFITLYGNGKGIRSNIEYEKAPPAGVGAVTTYPSGAAQFVLGSALTIGFSVPATSVANYRSSGVVIKGLTISGHNAPSVTQTAISIQSDNDGYTIEDNCIINLRGYGINIKGNDALVIRNNWVCECRQPLLMIGGKESQVQGNTFGGFPAGITCDIQDQIRLNFSCNNICPDGYTGLNLLHVRNSVFNSNVITGRFTGLVTLFLSYLNTFNDNVLRVPNDEVTDWTAGKSAWSTTNYDPKNRDILYGVVYVYNASNDNTFIGNSISGYISGSNPVLVRIGGNCNRNTFSSCRTATSVTSTLKWAIESGATNNALIYCDVAGQINDAGTGTLKTYLNG